MNPSDIVFTTIQYNSPTCEVIPLRSPAGGSATPEHTLVHYLNANGTRTSDSLPGKVELIDGDLVTFADYGAPHQLSAKSLGRVWRTNHIIRADNTHPTHPAWLLAGFSFFPAYAIYAFFWRPIFRSMDRSHASFFEQALATPMLVSIFSLVAYALLCRHLYPMATRHRNLHDALFKLAEPPEPTASSPPRQYSVPAPGPSIKKKTRLHRPHE